MKIRLKILVLSLLGITIFTGCSVSSTPEILETEKAYVLEKQKIEISNEDQFTDLEREIKNIAIKNERRYNEYIQILTELKSSTKLYKKGKIPKRMGRRFTFKYDGPALVLLKNLAQESNYYFDDNKYRIYDSKNISRVYEDTMLIDIIYDITDTLNYDVFISEKLEKIELLEK